MNHHANGDRTMKNRIYAGGIYRRQPTRWWWLVAIVWAWVATPLWAQGAQPQTDRSAARPGSIADRAMADGLESYQYGDYEAATTHWQQAVQHYEKENRPIQRIDAMRNLATVLRDQGQYRLANELILEALELAKDLADRPRQIQLYNEWAVLSTLRRQTDDAQARLAQALAMAQADGDLSAEAKILNNLGNLLVTLDQYDEALDQYRRSADLAQRLDQPRLQARALTNGAMCAALNADTQAAAELNRRARQLAESLPVSHTKASLLIAIGHNGQQLLDLTLAQPIHPRQQQLDETVDTYRLALSTAKDLGDATARAFVLSKLAEIYESHGRGEDALSLIGRALSAAPKATPRDILYRWQWQAGRLMNQQGRSDDAINAYTAAVASLESVRQEVTFGYGNRFGDRSFRQRVGALYYELADLLLQRAGGAAEDESLKKKDLTAAQENIERLKTAQLVDYFDEQCVAELQAQLDQVTAISPGTVVVYPIPLADRTALLLSFSDELKLVTAPVGRDELFEEARRFRYELENLATRTHLLHAQQLDQWLIEPIKAQLESHGIDTIVWVPDGPLGLIPIAALHDGQRFLAQRYACAVVPGLTLMDPQPLAQEKLRLLACGLSVSPHEGLAPLVHVPQELDGVTRFFESKTLLDDQFLLDRLQREVRESPYSIVHIASHGQFGHDAKDTFVWTYDKKLTLADLEQLIRPARFRDDPVELLVLSACQTASGDDRTALGLAGIALRAGARSAMATLWSIDDEASTQLVTEFYRQLHDDPTISKVKALQRAQNRIIEDREFEDPYYWSAYLVVGNWQ